MLKWLRLIMSQPKPIVDEELEELRQEAKESRVEMLQGVMKYERTIDDVKDELSRRALYALIKG